MRVSLTTLHSSRSNFSVRSLVQTLHTLNTALFCFLSIAHKHMSTSTFEFGLRFYHTCAHWNVNGSAKHITTVLNIRIYVCVRWRDRDREKMCDWARERRESQRENNTAEKKHSGKTIEHWIWAQHFFLYGNKHWEKRVMDDVRSPSKYEMPVHIYVYISEAHRPSVIVIRYKLANGIDSTKQSKAKQSNTEFTFTVTFKQQSHTVRSSSAPKYSLPHQATISNSSSILSS